MPAINIYSVGYLVIISFLLSCSHPKIKDSKPDTKETRQMPEIKSQKVELRTYQNMNGKTNGWGYDIYVDSQLYVHQPHIPAFSGERGFKTEEQAIKVGGLVMQKIKDNIIPPTVSKEELDSLKIE